MQPQEPENQSNETPNFDALDKQSPESSTPEETPQAQARKFTNAVIAEKAGLSASTVSRAINQPDKVSEDTRRRVSEAIKLLEASSNDEPEEEQEEVQEVEVVVTPKKSKEETNFETMMKEIGTYTGRSSDPQNQYMQVGLLVDMWADVIEGYGGKAKEFYKQFKRSFLGRKIKPMTVSFDNLYATGLYNAPYRKMLFIKRKPVTVTLYIATQGQDLYVSWRAFVQSQIAMWKIGVLAGVSAFVGFLAMSVANNFDRRLVDFQNYIDGGRRFHPPPNTEIGIAWAVAFFVIVGGWLLLQAYQKLDGDFLGYFREPLYELDADDVAAASAAVHKSIFYAADKLGIDTTKLEVREPFYKERKKRRF